MAATSRAPLAPVLMDILSRHQIASSAVLRFVAVDVSPAPSIETRRLRALGRQMQVRHRLMCMLCLRAHTCVCVCVLCVCVCVWTGDWR